MTQVIVKDFKSTLQKGSKSAKVNNHLPALGMVLLDISGGGLVSAMSFDGERRAVASCEAQHTDPFYTLIPQKSVIEWVDTCNPKSTIELTFYERTQILQMENERSRAQFKCIDGDELLPWFLEVC